MLILVAASVNSTEAQAIDLADRCAGLRIFADDAGKMNLALKDLPPSDQAEALVVSQFTLYGDVWSSRRPSFVTSAAFERGRELYELFVNELRQRVRGVETGEFGAMMQVELVNDGPVTLVIDARER